MTTNVTRQFDNITLASSECQILQTKRVVLWNTSDAIVSTQTEQLVRNLNFLVFLPLAVLIGVPANLINMVVFYRHGLKDRINVCLFALSLSDGLYLVSHMIVNGERSYMYFTTKETYGPVVEWILNQNLMGFCAFNWVSQVLTAIVASERCFCVLQPLKSQTILHTSTMTGIVIVVFIVVIGLRFIVATRYYIICAYDPISDTTFRTGGMREFYRRNKQLVDLLDVAMYGLGLPWVMIVLIITATVITVIKLRQAAEWRTGTSSSSGSVSARDIALTRMLVGNSIFFIICVFPVGLFRLVLPFMPEMNFGRKQNSLFLTGIYLLNIISYINATFNFVVYYAMGSRYRHTVHTLLGRKNNKTKCSDSSVKHRSMSVK